MMNKLFWINYKIRKSQWNFIFLTLFNLKTWFWIQKTRWWEKSRCLFFYLIFFILHTIPVSLPSPSPASLSSPIPPHMRLLDLCYFKVQHTELQALYFSFQQKNQMDWCNRIEYGLQVGLPVCLLMNEKCHIPVVRGKNSFHWYFIRFTRCENLCL